MITKTYPVFVDDADGKPTISAGETLPVTTYERWDEVPESERARIIADSNRQRIQDAKNRQRVIFKDSQTDGPKAWKAEQKQIMDRIGSLTHTPQDIVRLGELARKLS